MHRCHLATLLCACVLGCLTGCGIFSSGPTAHSDRTADAYPHPLIEGDYADEKLRQYTRDLERFLTNRPAPPVDEQTAAQVQAVSMQPRNVELLPFGPEDVAAAGPRNPLRAPIRIVPPILAAPGVIASDSPQGTDETEQAGKVPPLLAATRPAQADANAAAKQAMANYLDVDYVEAMAAKTPDDLDLQLKARLLLLAGHHDEQALKPVPGLSDKENQTVEALLRMMIAIRDHKSGPPNPEEAAKRLMAVDMLRQELMQMADLEIPVIKLCTRIDSFGVFQAFPDTNFVAGQSHYMYVYCELRNFTVKNEGGTYRTYLNVQHVLYDEDGKVVLSQVDKDVSDISANRRTDFYLTRLLVLPPSLPAGAYTLKVTVEDPAANKVKTASLPIILTKPTKEG